jgi:hypothetical protein
MRHSRISTTMDIYAQIVPTSQRRALQQLSAFASVGTIPAALQTAGTEEENVETDPRSKTFQIN